MTSFAPLWHYSLLGVLLALLGGCTVGDGAGQPQPPAEPILAMDDQFDGTQLDPDRWSTCHWWGPEGCTIASNDELEWYMAEQVSVQDGHLELTAESASEPQGPDELPYASGMVTTGPQEQEGPAKFAFTYGRVEVQFDAPEGRGLWPAIWMLPESTDSRPEIDLFEAAGEHPEKWVFHLHPADRDRDSLKSVTTDDRLGSGTHTIGLNWEPEKLVWSVDGTPVWTVTGPDVPSEPMYLVINLAVGGIFGGPPDESTQFPATFRIDRVRVWQAGQ